jgi:hypothetical protein
MRAALVTVAAIGLSGCLTTGAESRVWFVGAAAAPDPTRVAQCQSERTAHNDWTIVAAGAGALTGVAGAVAPAAPMADKTPLAVFSAFAGVFTAIAAAFVSSSANDYAQDDCQAVLTADAGAP